MAKYNVSKSEAAKLGIERVKIDSSKSRGGLSVKEARKKLNVPTKVPASVSEVKTSSDAKSFVNGNQAADVASKDLGVRVRESAARYQGIADELGMGDKLKGLDAPMPEAPNFEQTYTQLRADSAVTDLETHLTDLEAQKEEAYAQFRTNRTAERGKPVAMNVIEGRVNDVHAVKAQEDIDFIDRQINTVTNQLQMKYSVIDSIIKFKGMDYEIAKGQYDTQFSQAMQTMNLVKGIDDTIKSDMEREQDNARANLQIIYNNVANNPLGAKSLDKKTQSMVSKLELQAGLPMGTYKSIAAKNPGGEIVTTKSWQDAAGKEYVSVVTRQPDGSLKTSNEYVGQGKVASSGSSTKMTADEKEQFQKTKTETLFEATKGKDGHVNPAVWNDALRLWNGSASDFVAKFANYANPKDKYNGITR